MDYWTKRTLQNQLKADALSSTYAARCADYMKKAHKTIETQLDGLLAAIDMGYEPTRTELWNMVKWVNLKEEIEKQTKIVGRLQLDDINEISSRIYNDTVGLTLAEFIGDGKYNLRNAEQTSRILNAAFEDVKYSQKVWGGSSVATRIGHNATVLSERVQKDITDMVVLGKSPTKIKEQLASDFGTAYSNADRLIRTEANHVYNTAARDSYKAAGVQKVLFYPESDCCEECESYKGEYDIDALPLLPIHPNCRCCYVPVVDLSVRD